MKYSNDCYYIEDGNALLHALKDLPPTFGETYIGSCIKHVLDQTVHTKNFVFSTNGYHPNSIKSHERVC